MLEDNFTILLKIKHIFFINICADIEMLLKSWRKTKILLLIVFCFFVLHIAIHLFFMKSVSFFKNNVEGVRIVIVDQHNEVIPHWYQAVEDKIILETGNTLIHIDGHADLAPPENYDLIKDFDPYKKNKVKNYLPMMQSNDVFILSAIMKGLINHVIWIKPSWLNGSNASQFHNYYIGTTKINETKLLLCICRMEIFRKGQKQQCYVLSRILLLFKELEIKKCQGFKNFTVLEISEYTFVTNSSLQNYDNIFVDIDEDFFGAEGGVQVLVDKGISLNTINTITSTFSQLFCPKTNKEEENLNSVIKYLFLMLARFKVLPTSNKNYENFKMQATHLLKMYLCTESEERYTLLFNFLEDIYNGDDDGTSFQLEEIKELTVSRFCLRFSPQLNDSVIFTLCHGNIYPDDSLNQIHAPSKKEILKKGEILTQVLCKIYEYEMPSFYTVARSLRDGYTPREEQQYIEETIFNSLVHVLEKYNKTPNVVYDRFLLFGKNGWESKI